MYAQTQLPRTVLRTGPRLVRALAIVCLLVAAAAVPTPAQLRGHIAITIPFDFVVGKTTLPAGDYQVRRMTEKALLIQRTDGSAAKIVLTTFGTSPRADGKARLVFTRYGDEHFLNRVCPSGTTQFYYLPKSRVEQRLAKASPRPDEVTLVAEG